MGGGARPKKKVPHKSKSGLFISPKNNQPGRFMERGNNDKTRRQWKYFTHEERIRLETLCKTLYPGKKEPNFAELGRHLNRHRSSISREYHRGKVINVNSDLEQFFVYSACKGQDKATAASSAKGPTGKLTNHIAADISELIIGQNLSPYAALIRLAKSGKHPWLPSERSVYYAIDEGLLGVSREQLPYKPRKKKHRKSGTRMAYNNPQGRTINMRPDTANDRSEYGHWEMDTVVGGKGTKPACLLVLTERMLRQQIIRKIPSRTQKAVVRALNKIEREPGSIFKSLKTITSDNGNEFLDIEGIERSINKNKKKRCELFFAHPYTASERGSNENANRIVRRFIPKGVDISAYSKHRVQEIEDWINELPRKLFDGMSAQEMVQQYFIKEAA
jgi:IS30 family transposase